MFENGFVVLSIWWRRVNVVLEKRRCDLGRALIGRQILHGLALHNIPGITSEYSRNHTVRSLLELMRIMIGFAEAWNLSIAKVFGGRRRDGGCVLASCLDSETPQPRDKNSRHSFLEDCYRHLLRLVIYRKSIRNHRAALA